MAVRRIILQTLLGLLVFTSLHTDLKGATGPGPDRDTGPFSGGDTRNFAKREKQEKYERRARRRNSGKRLEPKDHGSISQKEPGYRVDGVDEIAELRYWAEKAAESGDWKYQLALNKQILCLYRGLPRSLPKNHLKAAESLAVNAQFEMMKDELIRENRKAKARSLDDPEHDNRWTYFEKHNLLEDKFLKFGKANVLFLNLANRKALQAARIKQLQHQVSKLQSERRKTDSARRSKLKEKILK